MLFYKKSNKNIKFISKNTKKDFSMNVDEQQMSMAISNLIQNSIESINEYKNKNKELVGKIKLSIYFKKNYVYVKIEDNGRGLPKNFPKNRILEPYITTKKNGTGLGLAIVLRIIEEHNGNFYIEDNKTGVFALIELPKK
jgi:two-component system nitrogen regulation sensor histidine kinase NtrY